ncbi:MAG: lipoate--protein ligase family protein [Rikenellaceae bacterium]|nr:lipoate--protein ligase family protein [Rikenellaceae bacterium]
MKLIVSNSNSPYFNIASEKHILTERLHEDVLFLYRNLPCVVVGRNQIPEAEVDTEFCRKYGIHVLKRLSGGGTVYHDPGNINYCFVKDKGSELVLDVDFLEPVVAVLSGFGIKAEKGKRKDLWLDGKKISGTASHITKHRVMFHGTLLYDSDLAILNSALRGDESLRGKSVASVRSEVTNIIRYMAEKLSVNDFFVKLIEGFVGYYSLDGYEKLSDPSQDKYFEK